MRIASKGKALVAEKKLRESNLKDGDLVIAVIARKVSKPRVDPVPVEQAPAPASAPAPAPAPAPEPAAPAPTAPASDAPVATTLPAPLPAGGEHEPMPLPMPIPAPEQPAQQQPGGMRVDEAAVSQLVEMGFPRDQVEAALAAAYNDVGRAVQYLTEGIPDGVHNNHDTDDEDGDGDFEGERLSQEAFAALLQQPAMLQMRAAVRQQPQLLDALLSEMQRQNPQLYQVLVDNRETFARWLDEAPGSSSGGAQPGVGGMAPPRPPQGETITLSPEDRAAIAQIMEMGFDQASAIQAYLACDKNVQLAVNFLMENQL